MFSQQHANLSSATVQPRASLHPLEFATNLVAVRVASEQPSVYAYLRDFFHASPGRPVSRTIHCCGADSEFPSVNVRENKHGVKYAVQGEDLYLQSSDANNLAISTRKAIRELHLSQCEAKNFTVLHGSAMYNEDSVILFVGTNGAGKTTLALDGWLNHGFKLLANDHVVVMRDGPGFQITGLTTFFTLKFAHIEHVFPQLSSIVRLHHPTIEGYAEEAKNNPRHPFYFGPQHFGVGEIPVLSLGSSSRKLFVVLPRISQETVPLAEAVSPEGLQSAITEQIRTEWVYNDDANPQFFGFPRRSAATFQADSERLCADLSKIGSAHRFQHAFSLSPLLANLK